MSSLQNKQCGLETQNPIYIENLSKRKQEMAMMEDSEKIVINVGGVQHVTYKSTLKMFPGTRLALLADSASDVAEEAGSMKEFFFDRDPGMFAYILNYYRTGSLSFPTTVCGCLYEKELVFWGINERDMEPCCWVSYCTHRDRIEALSKLGASSPGGVEHGTMRSCSSPRKWALFDDPQSSIAAKVIAVLSLIIIVISIGNKCLETHPYFHNMVTDHHAEEDMESRQLEPFAVFFILEAICSVWFVFEFLVRAVCCPNKLHFIKNILNIVDFLALLPFYFQLSRSVGTSRNILGFIWVLRFVRLLRVFKLMKSFICMQVLGHTLKASLGYFNILIALVGVASFMFGSLFFYSEAFLTEGSHIDHIPIAAWWAVISLTTIGYGDIYPQTWLGQIVGSLCAVAGVVILALPVPALVNNFRIYHTLALAKQKHMKK
ncbi:hypothetical protein AGOR_G00156670 [Albula goreensis]|uniref:BTB domain-containing protein n=1 Tax=Albula goreensis TaxID=1534307 RepID=A0A8T3CZF5_9TELE|nr:hypothetical protein AGOR_G00156670 [Albula goreensis]